MKLKMAPSIVLFLAISSNTQSNSSVALRLNGRQRRLCLSPTVSRDNDIFMRNCEGFMRTNKKIKMDKKINKQKNRVDIEVEIHRRPRRKICRNVVTRNMINIKEIFRNL